MMEYNAPHDRLSQTLTITISAFLALMYFTILKTSPDMATSLRTLIVALFLLIIILPYLFSVRKYRLSSGNIEVCFTLGRKTITMAEIESIDLVENKAFFAAMRLFGSSGFFGYSGIYLIKGHGKVTVFSNRRENLVQVKTKKGKKYYFGPDKLSEFIHELRNYIPKT